MSTPPSNPFQLLYYPTMKITFQSPPLYSTLISQLTDLGYRRLTMVLEPGEFAVRGSIVDVFPANHSHPIRLEYDGDSTLDRMHSFNVHTQRSLSSLTETQVDPASSQDTLFRVDVDDTPQSDQVLTELEVGDYVVHENYGLGQYKGLIRLKLNKGESEYLWVQYRGEDKLYIPLDQLHFIHRYSGPDMAPVLNSLHDGAWKKTKAKAQKELEILAQDVYLIQKKRTYIPGFSCAPDSALQLEFESKFPYTPTPDQRQSAADIKSDMERAFPMDRVLCGDVGYGKTEVVMRAAFKACDNGKQVAVLVPTTLLAQQHEQVFKERFLGFPFRVEGLSRFKSKKDVETIRHDLHTGDIRILVGTHQMLQDKLHFKDLGLLVIDEEQRFGVTHKDRLKIAHEGVDVLSVSATPIPRTLYMSLTGARDFSTIKTPPTTKRAVVTTLGIYTKERVIEAVQFELNRGGQVYYVFNHVEHMARRLAELTRLLPGVRIQMAHGQLPEAVLERTMFSFWKHEFDVLLCSTIIENGLDMPNVNTIILERADLLGLSQIHQLRGRVGRGKQQGYAHMMYPADETLSDKSKARLAAIKSYAALGSGHHLAMKDLEIRGAGSLLGKRQHGHMTAIGFELYCKLLSDAVSKRNGHSTLPSQPKLQLPPESHMFIPDTYIEDPRERLTVYQRMSSLRYGYEWEDLCDELEDRYGAIPPLVLSFLKIVRQGLS
jgi:transcription-repair coupling factor (superfamily II helicase)